MGCYIWYCKQEPGGIMPLRLFPLSLKQMQQTHPTLQEPRRSTNNFLPPPQVGGGNVLTSLFAGYTKSYGWIFMKFGELVDSGPEKS